MYLLFVVFWGLGLPILRQPLCSYIVYWAARVSAWDILPSPMTSTTSACSAMAWSCNQGLYSFTAITCMGSARRILAAYIKLTAREARSTVKIASVGASQGLGRIKS